MHLCPPPSPCPGQVIGVVLHVFMGFLYLVIFNVDVLKTWAGCEKQREAWPGQQRQPARRGADSPWLGGTGFLPQTGQVQPRPASCPLHPCSRVALPGLQLRLWQLHPHHL